MRLAAVFAIVLIAAISCSGPVAATQPEVVFGNGYPLHGGLDCSAATSHNGNSSMPPGVIDTFYFNTTSQRLHVAAFPGSVLQVWNGYPVGTKTTTTVTAPTLWNANSILAHESGYRWSWDDASSSFRSQQRQPASNLCLAYAVDPAAQQPSDLEHMIVMQPCGNGTSGNFSTRFSRRFTGEHADQFPVFKLVQLDLLQHGGDFDATLPSSLSSSFCMGLPVQFREGRELLSDSVRLTVGIGGLGAKRNYTYVQSLRIRQPGFAGRPWSVNLLDSASRIQNDTFSMTSIEYVVPSSSSSPSSLSTEESRWVYSQGGRFVDDAGRGDTIVIDDIAVGAVAREKWTFRLVAGSGGTTTLSWKVERTYTAQAGVEMKATSASRLPFFVFTNNFDTVGNAPVDQQAQIVASLDPTYTRNASSPTGSSWIQHVDGNRWVFAYSNKTRNFITLSPACACISWAMSSSSSSSSNNNATTAVRFAQAWAPRDSDYSLGHNSFGLLDVGTIASESAPSRRVIPAGTVTTAELSLTLENGGDDDDDDDGFARVCGGASNMTFRTANATRDKLLREVMQQFSMWAGNVMGNSPSSVSCVFETTFYAQIASLLDTEGALPDVLAALRYELAIFLSTQVAASGAVNPQWSEHGSNPGAYAQNMWQAQTQLLNAVAQYAVTSGDVDFVRQWWWRSPSSRRAGNESGPLRRALFFLLGEMGMSKDGLARCLGNSTGNSFATSSCTWFDIVAFGGRVSILNAEALAALSSYAEIASVLGDDAVASMLPALYQRGKAAFQDAFWDDAAGLFADWVGDDGKQRTFAYVWSQGIAADIFSRSDDGNSAAAQQLFQSRIRRAAATIDSLYPQYAAALGNNVSLFGPPTNFIPVPREFQWLWFQQRGVYENGALFTLMCYFEQQLRFATGQAHQRRAAIALVDRMLAQFAENKLWGQHFQWFVAGSKGSWTGGDVLTDAAMLVVGFLRGGLRLRPTLTRGVLIDGDAGAEFAGTEFVFRHLGKRVKAVVGADGKTRIFHL